MSDWETEIRDYHARQAEKAIAIRKAENAALNEDEIRHVAEVLFGVQPDIPAGGEDNREIARHLLRNGIGPR